MMYVFVYVCVCVCIGPTQQQLQETSFEFDFRLTGHKVTTSEDATSEDATSEKDTSEDDTSEDSGDTTSMRVRVSGPEPGYVATPKIFVALARCLLDEYGLEGDDSTHSLPRGGVLTPQAVFASSLTIFDRLAEAELVFEVV
jgi:short subunit dehydrogenase-like uncharacterized protein